MIFFVVTGRKIEDRFEYMTLLSDILFLAAVQSQYRVSMVFWKEE